MRILGFCAHSEDGCHECRDTKGPSESDLVEEELVEDGHVLSSRIKVFVGQEVRIVKMNE